MGQQPLGGPEYGVEYGWIPRIHPPKHADAFTFTHVVSDTDADSEHDVTAVGGTETHETRRRDDLRQPMARRHRTLSAAAATFRALSRDKLDSDH